LSAVEGTKAPGIDCAVEVGWKAYEVTDPVARAGSILERPLRGQVARDQATIATFSRDLLEM
jgi:hypothetical protein